MSLDAQKILLTTAQAAQRLGVKSQTLRKWRLRGHGPVFIRLGQRLTGRAMYATTDLEIWLSERSFASTSDEAAAAGCSSDRGAS